MYPAVRKSLTWETPEIAVKPVPAFVVWKRPLSDETHTSPVIDGFTTTLTGDVMGPRVPAVALKVLPPSLEVKKLTPEAA
jgi:hypothetical protein